MYTITLKDGSTRQMTKEEFALQFGRAGHNFQTRLEQFKTIYPTAIDWELD